MKINRKRGRIYTLRHESEQMKRKKEKNSLSMETIRVCILYILYIRCVRVAIDDDRFCNVLLATTTLPRSFFNHVR